MINYALNVKKLGKIEEQLPHKSVGWLSINSQPTNDQQVANWQMSKGHSTTCGCTAI